MKKPKSHADMTLKKGITQMSKRFDPRIENILKEGVMQSITFWIPSPGRLFRRILQKDDERSPAAHLTEVRELTIRPFRVIPFQAYTNRELIIMPKHGHADILIWDPIKRKATTFKLYMGDGPVAVHVASEFAIRTFANKVRLTVVEIPLQLRGTQGKHGWQKPRILWQKNAKKLCQNKHLEAS